VLYDTIIRYLREAIRAAAVLGIVVAIGAFLTGPSVTATAIRGWLVAGFAWIRAGVKNAGVGLESTTAWVASRARVLRACVVVAAFAVLFLQRYRTPELVLWLTLAVLVALAIIQFLATSPRIRVSEARQTVVPQRAVPAQS
jgi:hypothetical protein